ncbi:MAG: DEAD/DEAH box helicase [Elusimicrobia bacterium]|nr:DEAD/DEAH box helicase [Elusimicrobiota bacterium]
MLPILQRLIQGKSSGHIRTLILSPTREIAAQSIEHLHMLSRHVHLRGAAIYGGVPINAQILALKHGLDIISATPGRLLDHIWSARIGFQDLEILVLDEVDRMLDMGFLPDVKKIISLLPPKRQNLVFSATMPSEILKLVHEILTNPVMIQIGHRSSAAVGIRHAVYPVPRHLKTDLLEELLRMEGTTSALVFTRTKRAADKLTLRLKKKAFKVSVLHGDRSQSQRVQALENFRNGYSQVLVATDIAARGIDIEDISHVINFDIPVAPEDYVHRIGRTGRAESTGDAFSLMDRSEEGLVKDIESALKQSIPRVKLPNFNYTRPAPPKPSHPYHDTHNRHHR